MKNPQALKGRITAIQTVHQITKAMEMIAASKLRQFKQKLIQSSAYAEAIHEMMGRLSGEKHAHPAGDPKPSEHLCKKNSVLVVVVSGTQGFCGNLNLKLFEKVDRQLEAWHAKGDHFGLVLLGEKAQQFFKKSRWYPRVEIEKSMPAQGLSFKDVVTLNQNLQLLYSRGSWSAIWVASHRFRSTAHYEPTLFELLPFQTFPSEKSQPSAPFIYETDPLILLEAMVPRYMDALVHQAVLEHGTCEMASRMIAMQGACENAEKLMEGLRLQANRTRQSSITQGVIEITSGAQALEDS